MTKESKTVEDIAVGERENNSAAIEASEGKPLDVSELAGMLDDMEEGVKLTGNYFKPELGEEVRCWLIGRTKMNSIEKPEEKVPAVRLLLKDETTVITASAIIVGTCSELSIPTALQIVKTGERDLGKGKKLSEFDIKELQRKL
ncbi:hypothetical protein LCGC14_2377760 [marine sediment metagenome]|uniref:Uncharacterized protein n=1 Tax=marine sediment metagenome TaxID=412755 RepID=A0A0F9EWH3_9ZZZZ